MAAKPIAVIGSMHTCPMCSGSTPHIGGAILGPGAAGVTINGQPVALQGDTCTCVGAIDTIVQGSAGVFINGVPVATVSCMTAHGGIITTGITGVTISANTPDDTVTLAPSEIPKEETSMISNIMTSLSGNSNKEALANQEKLLEESDEPPLVYNPQWIKEEQIIRGSKELKQVTLKANTHNIPDGETVTIKLKHIPNQEEHQEIKEFTGQVKDKKVILTWETEVQDSTTD